MKNVLLKIKNLPGIIGKFILRYSKYFFPGFALIITAVIVVLALNHRQRAEQKRLEQEALEAKLAEEAAATIESGEVPLEENVDEKLASLMETFYTCLSDGNTDKLPEICEDIDESDLIKLNEQSKYVDYTVENVYSQSGPEEGSYIAYVYCTVVFDRYPDIELPGYNGFYVRSDADGNLRIVKGELTDQENEYISEVASQDDVRELNNKVNVEYNDTVLEHPEILDYLMELDNVVSTSVGERIAEMNSTIASATQEDEGEPEVAEEEQQEEEVPAEPAVIYATATTRVNIRASDSANAERVGEAMTGDKFEVVEELVNGWTKIIYDGKEAYIKSEYLSMIQSAEGQPTIGMLTAKSEVNIRSLPDSESEKVGALVAGDQLEIVAVEDGWCTVKFEDMLAYVNADYVDCTIF